MREVAEELYYYDNALAKNNFIFPPLAINFGEKRVTKRRDKT